MGNAPSRPDCVYRGSEMVSVMKSEVAIRPQQQDLAVAEQKPAHALDLAAVPRELALPLLANELGKLAGGMVDLKDLMVQLDVSPSGATSLRFRAYSRF